MNKITKQELQRATNIIGEENIGGESIRMPKDKWEKDFDKIFITYDIEMTEYFKGCCRNECETKVKHIKDFIHNLLQKTKEEVKVKIQFLINEECRIAIEEGTPTSRLTSLYNKIDKIKYEKQI